MYIFFFLNQRWPVELILCDLEKEDLWKTTDADDLRDLNDLHL